MTGALFDLFPQNWKTPGSMAGCRSSSTPRSSLSGDSNSVTRRLRKSISKQLQAFLVARE
jgi:hypothetical protein